MRRYGYCWGILLLLSLFLFSGCKKEEPPVVQKPPQETKEQTEVPKEEEKEPEVKTVKLSVTGDLMVHNYQYNEAYDPATGEYDFMHNFADIKRYFADSDIVIGNLETVFAGEDVGYSDYPCFNTPDSFVDALKDAGFTLLTTANNHCMDKGEAGLLRTLDILDEAGIAHVGTYRSVEEKNTIFIQEVNGMKIAFLSFTYGTNGIPVPKEYLVNIMSEEFVKSEIAKARALNPDVIVVLPHMGNEYETYVRDVFKDWADLMFDAGADIILASHPHVLQPMEYRTIKNADGSTREGFIIYSLGNCISSQTTPPRNAGVILNIILEKVGEEKTQIKDVSFIPIWTQFRLPSGEDHFVVRSVYEMLTLPPEEQTALLRQKDIARLKEIHKETTSMLLGEEVPIEEIKDSYHFPKPVETQPSV